MKRIVSALLLQSVVLCSLAQTWESVSFESNMVWQAAELNGKLYIADGGAGLQEYNGTAWTALTDLNNSFNTPNKSKSSVVNIGGLLYAGARDFNTSGEGIMHAYNGNSFELFQNSDFQYNGSYKVFDFAQYNGSIYAAGQFIAPNNGSANIARWDGSDWVSGGTNSFNYLGNQNNVVSRLATYNGSLYAMAQGKVLYYNGAVWDSLPAIFSVFEDMVVYNSDLILCGTIVIGNNGTPVAGGSVVRWNGSQLTVINHPYDAVRRLYADGNILYAIVQVEPQGDVALVRYDGTNWSVESFLQEGNEGVVPGYPLPDYNRIFRYNNDLYIGGRFTEINNTPIQSLARFASGALAPAAPSNLTATPVNSIALTWQDNSGNEDGFSIEYTLDPLEGIWNEVASVGANETYYHHTGLTDGITYYYRVRAFNGNGNSTYSNIAQATEGDVSIAQFDPSAALVIYPNPVSDILRLSGLERNTVITILDIHGKKVMRAFPEATTPSLDVSALPDGVYLLIAENGNEFIQHRFVVRRGN